MLRTATPQESERFATALEESLTPSGTARYLVSRLVPSPGRSVLELVSRTLVRKPQFERRWATVPDDLGRRKDRAEAFLRAWRRWVGPSELRFTQRSDEGRTALAEAEAEADLYETARRRIWI